MALTKVTTPMIEGAVLNALSIGIVPNDNTKRAANTAALLAAWNTNGVRGVEFPPSDDTFYFAGFTLPQKVVFLKGHTTLRGNSGVILDIAQDPVSLVCIDTPVGSPQLSRFSRLENLIITAPLTATAIRVQNGGLMMDQILVTQANIGIFIRESYCASYTNILASAVTAGIKILNGVGSPNFVASNNFTNLALNNACGPTVSPGGGTPNGKGLWVDGDPTSNSSVFTSNTIQTLNCESCGWGVFVTGLSRDNAFINYYAENNQARNIEYQLPTNPACIQTDTWMNNYYGGGTYTPSPDFLPAYGADTGLVQINGGIVTAKTFVTPRVLFTNDFLYGNPQSIDYYEEGTWTPVVDRASSSTVTTYTSRVGTYVRIGKLVTAYGRIVINTVSTPGSGQNQVKNLPFASAAAADASCGLAVRDSALTSACKGGYTSSAILLLVDTSGVDIDENWVDGGTIEVSVTYYAVS
jgi:hypothetical protein